MYARAPIVVHAGVVTVLTGALVLGGCGGDSTSGVGTSTEANTTEVQSATTESTPTATVPTPAEPTVVRVHVVDGAPKGGIVREEIDQGDRVVIVVTSDVADEVHLHGYDLSRPVAAGGTTRLNFRATIPGRFEVELEERGASVAELTVRP